jgi:acyl carrier protein
MSEPILAEVQRLAADLFDLAPADVTPQTSPQNLEKWDSLQHLNLVLALEQRFGLQFQPEEIEQMSSIGRVAELVRSKHGGEA